MTVPAFMGKKRTDPNGRGECINGFTADGILARMKGSLKNEDSRIEGSFTMDNLQAVSEELARFNAMLTCSPAG